MVNKTGRFLRVAREKNCLTTSDDGLRCDRGTSEASNFQTCLLPENKKKYDDRENYLKVTRQTLIRFLLQIIKSECLWGNLGTRS